MLVNSPWRRLLSGAATATLATAAVAVLAPSAGAAAPGRPSGADVTASSTLAQLTGPTAVLAGLSRATRTGDLPGDQVLRIGVGVELPDIAGEKALAAAQQDPSSPQYHQWLTPAEFTARFGVDETTKAKTVSWLTSGGLSILTSSAVGDYYTASGTVDQIDALLKVSEGSYHYIDSKLGAMTFYANDVAPSVPVDVPVAQVMGLDNVHRYSSEHIAGSYDKQAAIHTVSSTPAASTVSTFTQGLTPQNLWSIYNEPATDTGQGQTAGLFGEGESDSVVADLRLFENLYSFPKVPVKVIRTETESDGSVDPSKYGDNGGAVEWNLDSQGMTGMAPNLAGLDLYFAKTLYDPDIAVDFQNWANDPNGPAQMNASFGECETSPGNEVTGQLSQKPYGSEVGDELEPVAEAILLQANLEGRGLFASAGDTGSGCPEVVVPVAGAGNGVAPQPGPIVNYPCTSQYVTCVGGSVIKADTTTGNTRTDERSWETTGGGASHYVSEPAFQSKVTAVDLPCVSADDGTPTVPPSTCRGVPDVAALSGNILGNGYELFADGAEITTGGTSLSSPLWVGMWSRVSAAETPAQASSSGKGASIGGFAAASLYPLYGTAGGASTTYSRDFFDIVCSEDDACANGTDVGSGDGFYTPKAGWDYVSGLGSPNLTNIMADLHVGTVPNGGIASHVVAAGASAGSPPEAAATPELTSTVVSPQYNAYNPAAADPTAMMSAQQTNIGQLDVLSSTMSTNGSAKTLTITMTGTQFDGSIPTGASGVDYKAVWQYGQKAYFVDDSIDNTGSTVSTGSSSAAAAYSQGSAFAGSTNSSSEATATFANNTLTFTVPLSEVGSPQPGDLLSYPLAETSEVDGIGFVADRAAASSSDESSVGQAVCVATCSAVATPALPEAPYAALLPLAGLVLLGGAVAFRRRRAA